ncbi:MAG: sulfatase-like hydrolase/transferase [Acidobacteria bacterium]|nr:sulfatase-like hydrolase/transferase [Acidobacteriota bacterium]
MITRAVSRRCLVVFLACAGWTVAAPAQAVRYGFVIESSKVSGRMAPGETAVVPVTIRNTGTVAWDPARGYFLSYHWLTPAGARIVWDGLRTAFPRPVAPGRTVTVQARVQAPGSPGRALLQWDVVQEHVCWISEKLSRPPPAIGVTVEPARPQHAFSIVSASIPTWWASGLGRKIHVVLRNDGRMTWKPGEPINVSYHWLTGHKKMVVFDGERTRIPVEVAPGRTIAMMVKVLAPRKSGRLLLQIDMVHEGVCWFAKEDPTPARPVRVFVIPTLVGNPRVPLGVALLLVILVLIAVARRTSEPGWIVRLLALSDLAWLLVALTAKQRAVLDAGHLLPDPGSMWIALSGMAAFALLLLLLPHAIRPWATLAVAGILSFVILSDVVYVRYFGEALSLAALAAGRQVGAVHASIASLLHRRDLWLAADLVPGIVLAWAVRTLPRPKWRGVRGVAAACLAIALIPGLRTVWQAEHAKHGRFVQVFQSMFIVQRVGVLDYHLADIWSSLREHLLRPPLSHSERSEVLSWFEARKPLRRGTGRFFGVAKGMNLLMIQVESMQGFVIGLKVKGQEVTPNLDHWLPGCLWFPHCTDQTAQGRTSDGEITTQISLLPRAKGAYVFAYPHNHVVGLAGVLRARGYHTLSAVAFQPNFWNRRLMHPAFGYTQNLFASDFKPGERIGWGLNDRDFLLQMEARLARMPQPFCAWLITLSLHHPFEGFPDHLKELDVGSWEGTPFGNYMHTMHFFDKALKAMVDRLAVDGLLDHTVIVIWGDHDAGFAWTPKLAKAIGRPHTEAGWYISGRVPLIIHVPGANAPRGTFSMAAGDTDVAPTTAALFGIDPANIAWVGRNLLGHPGDVPMPRRYGSWVSNRHIYANHGPGWADGACYDFRTLAKLPVEACRAEDEAARQEMEVSDLVERYDLQQEITRIMEGKSPRAP